MKAEIVFYSYGGNAKACAQALAERLGADLFELQEVRTRKKDTSLYMQGGMQATFGLGSKLKALPDLKQADVVILGMPVWASAPPPAINAVLKACAFSGKAVYAFVTKADPSPDAPAKLHARLKKAISAKGGTLKGIFVLSVPMNQALTSDEALEKTAGWAERIRTGE